MRCAVSEFAEGLMTVSSYEPHSQILQRLLWRARRKDDYIVLDDKRQVIGRIMLHPQAPKNQPWFWTITALEQPPSIDNKGYSAPRERAMADFKQQWLARSSCLPQYRRVSCTLSRQTAPILLRGSNRATCCRTSRISSRPRPSFAFGKEQSDFQIDTTG
jgi:hypothetical protein